MEENKTASPRCDIFGNTSRALTKPNLELRLSADEAPVKSKIFVNGVELFGVQTCDLSIDAEQPYALATLRVIVGKITNA